jgi:hypothetical protein
VLGLLDGLRLGCEETLVVPERAVLLALVHRLAPHELVEVHFVGVELGTVHAREPRLARDAHAAAAAHAGRVDHD